ARDRIVAAIDHERVDAKPSDKGASLRGALDDLNVGDVVGAAKAVLGCTGRKVHRRHAGRRRIVERVDATLSDEGVVARTSGESGAHRLAGVGCRAAVLRHIPTPILTLSLHVVVRAPSELRFDLKRSFASRPTPA